MKRDISPLAHTQFDLLVIGGGVQGATICYKAAQRGLTVLLLEKGDFCSSSSSNSQKILHGGLRYLQTLDFKRMRDSIRSRREIMQMAPHLIEPLACAMPSYGHGLKGKELMRLAMLLNDGISLDRNTGLTPENHLPAGHTLSKQQCLEWVPGISTNNLHGAAVWYDALANNTERLVLEYILGAADLGARCINYVQVNSLHKNADQSIRAEVSDQHSNTVFTVTAKRVINSAGAAFEDLIPDSSKKLPDTRWARGLNIIVKKSFFPNSAVALEKVFDTRKQMLFLVPWRKKYTLIGTHYVEQPRNSALFPVPKKDIMALLDEVNAIYPPANLHFADISFYHAGLLPMRQSSGTEKQDIPNLAKESTIINHGKQDGFAGVFSIRGIKYTTAPQVADKVLSYLQLTPTGPGKISECSPVPTKAKTEMDAWLKQKYGNRYAEVRPYVDAAPRWLDKQHSLLKGEIHYFIQVEMAIHLDDIVFRRSDLGTAECPSMDVLQDIVEIMASHFNWSKKQIATELKRVLLRYQPLQAAPL